MLDDDAARGHGRDRDAQSEGGGPDAPSFRDTLKRWNATEVPIPEVRVHELFEQQVDRTPDAVAVVHGPRSLTYRELDRRANQLAHVLRERGVGEGALVAVCVERSPEMVMALLGIWKAGAAYVPLDPGYPRDRLAFMMTDSDARTLVMTDSLRPLFPDVSDRILSLDGDPALARASDARPRAPGAPESLAYVMYTSGSTGRPKGAMITHRGLVNYLLWAVDAYRVEAGLSVPVHSSLSFDLTVTSLYPALLVGGSIELLDDEPGAQHLVRALRRAGVRALVKITPAHLEILTQSFSPEEVRGMTRSFVIGGENLRAEGLRLWREFAPATRLINEYGPTETVVGCCVHEVAAGDPGEGSVPIGRPIANTKLYVLDGGLEPVPPGVVGELFIGGAGVALGYFNRPELTAERFLPDPFASAGARMYKTGDLARYRADGTLEYLGRVDNQVKLRGHRVELGEIEAAVAAYKGVRSCAVVLREDAPGEQELVAYVVAEPETTAAMSELREHLKQVLPEVMVPRHVVLLEALPLTRNGKVDRDALPAPQAEARDAHEPVGGGSATEQAVAQIWADFLKRDNLKLDEDLFSAGANSLVAVRALAKMRDTFGIPLAIRTVFEFPTVAELAEAIDRLKLVHAGAPSGGGEREEIEL